MTSFDVCSEVFEKIGKALLAGFTSGHEIIFVKVNNIIQASPKFDVESTEGPSAICLVFVCSTVTHTIKMADFFIPTSKEEGTDMFVLNGFLFGLDFEDTGPFIEFIMKTLPVTSDVMWSLTDIDVFLF